MRKRLRSQTSLLVVALALLVALVMPVRANDHQAPRSRGQVLYVPVYSAISYLDRNSFSLAVTISISNTDRANGLEVTAARYYGNDGTFVRDFLDAPTTLAPLGTTQLFIGSSEYRDDVGANFIIEWQSDEPISPPMVEAIMVGSKGTQGLAFTSRAVVVEEVAAP